MRRRDEGPQGRGRKPELPPQNQDLHAAAEALGRISHELKTPLVMIKGYAELILDQRDEPLSPTLRDWVRRIASAANRLDSLFRKVTGESRDDAAWSCHRTSIRPEEWLRRCVEETRLLSEKRSIRWNWSVAEGTPAVALDPEAGRDLLMELLQNAARATPDGGEVRVSAAAEMREGRSGLRVSVVDTGIGVPQGEAAEALFGRFSVLGTLHAHHSGEFEYGAQGLGLGLSLARSVARAHGGEAWAEGTGRDLERLPGATFHVWLPAAEGRASSGSTGADSDVRGRLLVADSDSEVRRILAAALAEVYEVEVAATADEALEKWRSAGNTWQGIVFDPGLSEAGGVAFARALRSTPETEGAALVSYGGTEAACSAEALRAAGVDACLWKPVRARVILQRLQAIKGRKSRQ